ncbi:MAG: hypothetical protein KBT48_05520 [Firmicutes bacterium]|nr:hypothetical protein [Bacillota bacterium]
MKKIISIVFMVILTLSMSLNISAHEVPDLEGTGSITIHYKDVKTGSLIAYKIGDINENDGDYSFVLSEAFKDSGYSLENLQSKEVSNALLKYAKNNKISGNEKNINNGTVSFTDLPVGLYLIAQKKKSTGYKEIQPFMVSLPRFDKEKGEYVYDVNATPKTSIEKETKPTPVIPNTGLLWWPVPVCIILGLSMIIIGIYKERKKEED